MNHEQIKESAKNTANYFLNQAVEACELQFGKLHTKDAAGVVAAWMATAQGCYAKLIDAQMVEQLTEGVTQLAQAINALNKQA